MESINANETFKKYQSVNNDSLTNKSFVIESSNTNPLEVEAKADRLVEIFGSARLGSDGKDISWAFYCKATLRIPNARLEMLIVQAREKGRNKGALFNYLVRKELGEL